MFPFSYLTGSGHDHGGRFVEVVEERLRSLLAPLIQQVEVEEAWYLEVNDDVRRAMAAGQFASAREHYAIAGYFEDRLPRPVTVDEFWYLKTYPDVAEAIRAGIFTSAQQHFGTSGFKEGRLPSEGWSLQSDRG